MNFMDSFQFTPLVPQGNGPIQAYFLVESSQPSNSPVFFFNFFLFYKIYTRAGKN